MAAGVIVGPIVVKTNDLQLVAAKVQNIVELEVLTSLAAFYDLADLGKGLWQRKAKLFHLLIGQLSFVAVDGDVVFHWYSLLKFSFCLVCAGSHGNAAVRGLGHT